MRKIISLAGLCLIFSSSTSTALASGKLEDYRTSHLLNSFAIPNAVYTMNATHKINIHVQAQPISEIMINIPEQVKITQGIKVENKTGEMIDATVSIDGQTAKLVFSQPISPEAIISIIMSGVSTPRYSNNWQYRVSVQKVGFNEVIPLGISRIQTYK